MTRITTCSCDMCKKKFELTSDGRQIGRANSFVTLITLDGEELNFCDIRCMLSFYKDDESVPFL